MRTDIFQEAKRRIDRKRMNQEVALSSRLDEIRDRVPEIIRIRQKLAMTGAEVSKLILSRSTDLASGIARIERENLALQQQEKDLLKANGYPENYLELQYSCPFCKDSGFTDNGRCICLNEEIKRLQIEALNDALPRNRGSFDDFDLSYYPDQIDPATGQNPRVIMQRVIRYCKQYAEEFRPDNPSLFMAGETGLGKTHLSLAIAAVVAAKGYSVVFGSAQDLLRRVENEHFGRCENKNTLDTMLQADLLILDDLGSEFSSGFTQSIVYNIVSGRLSEGKPVIISTNLKAQELEDKYAQRIVSRLFTQFVQIRFIGRDVRQLKRQREMARR